MCSGRGSCFCGEQCCDECFVFMFCFFCQYGGWGVNAFCQVSVWQVGLALFLCGKFVALDFGLFLLEGYLRRFVVFDVVLLIRKVLCCGTRLVFCWCCAGLQLFCRRQGLCYFRWRKNRNLVFA